MPGRGGILRESAVEFGDVRIDGSADDGSRATPDFSQAGRTDARLIFAPRRTHAGTVSPQWSRPATSLAGTA